MATHTHFLYRLKLNRPAGLREGFTPEELAVMTRHRDFLAQLTEQRRIVLAGRTDTGDERTFGVVIYPAASIDEARQLMESDPAVSSGLMDAELFPFFLSFLSGPAGAPLD